MSQCLRNRQTLEGPSALIAGGLAGGVGVLSGRERHVYDRERERRSLCIFDYMRVTIYVCVCVVHLLYIVYWNSY